MNTQKPAEDSVPKAKPVRFPYKDLAATQADGFKKLGGPDRAFKYLVKGYKSTVWRKRAEQKVKDEIREEEARMAAQQQQHKK